MIQSIAYSQIDTLDRILRGCLTDVYRLDSCQASAKFSDSIIIVLLIQRQAIIDVIDFQAENISRLRENDYLSEDEIKALRKEIRKQKRKKIIAFFTGTAIGAVIIMTLIIL